MMRIHKEGRQHITFGFLTSIVMIIISWSLCPVLLINLFITFAFSTLLFLIIWFFRVPYRPNPESEEVLYAPADGKIVVIEKTQENEYFKDERIQISIFMSPLNVHVNTYPQSGEVIYTKYYPGKYLVAWHPKSSTENERSVIVYRNEKGVEIMVKQIAGAVARRICTYAKPGIKAQQGDELGFIKFGSRVDILLPVQAEILCGLNQKSFSKITPIARLA